MDRSGNTLPGTVYIYAGAGNDVIRQTPIQVMTITYTYIIMFVDITQTIVGNELNLNLPVRPLMNGSFGCSLSSNVDVDNNGLNGKKK